MCFAFVDISSDRVLTNPFFFLSAVGPDLIQLGKSKNCKRLLSEAPNANLTKSITPRLKKARMGDNHKKALPDTESIVLAPNSDDQVVGESGHISEPIESFSSSSSSGEPSTIRKGMNFL